MIRGQLDARGVPVFRLHIRDTVGQTFLTDALVDTGFTGPICLPPSVLQSLGLTHDSQGTAFLADGSLVHYNIHPVELQWDGAWRRVSIWGLGDEPLVGCGLLRGYELRIEFEDAGAVEIHKL